MPSGKTLAKGDFKFTLEGNRLHGGFVLVRMANNRERSKRTNWLLIKHRDEFAVEVNGAAVLEQNDTSIASGRTMEAIAAGWGRKPKPFMLQAGKVQADAVWDSRSGLAAEERNEEVREKKKLSKAIARDLPDFVAPQLCQTLDRPPSADGWIHEIKFDGYRIQIRAQDGEAGLKTRKGLDWTQKYSAMAQLPASCRTHPGWGDLRPGSKRRAGFRGAAGGPLRRQNRSLFYFLSIFFLPGARICAPCRSPSASSA